jgi:CBS domain containing-hemolysin-like protein
MVGVIGILVAVVFVFLAGFFAGAETGIYRLSRFHLRIGIEQKRPLFRLLGRAMRDSQGIVLTALLGTNLSHYVVTSAVTLMLLSRVQTKHTAELYATLLVTPVLFVFSELIPKYLYFYRADALMPRSAPLLWAARQLFIWCGVMPVLKMMAASFARAEGSIVAAEGSLSPHRRHQFRQIIKETQEEGYLSRVQSDIINRLIDISHVRLDQVMVPIQSVTMVDLNTDRSSLLEKLRHTPYSRLPVYQDQQQNVISYVNIYDALGSEQNFTDLQQFVKPILQLPADTSITDALSFMRKQNAALVLVIQPRRQHPPRPVGIVTTKDLVEELTGELAEW